MRTPPARRGLGCGRGLASLALALVALSACGAAPRPDVPTPPPVTSTASIASPANAVSLASLGFSYGPVDRVFVPVGSSVTSRVDQANNVVLVLAAPSASSLAAFYRQTLPANGFVLTADDQATSTLTFTGFGWEGSFTGDSEASALLLRPAP